MPSAIGAPPASRTVARSGPLIRDHLESRWQRRCDRLRRRHVCACLCEPFNHSAGERTDRITHEIEARGVAAKKKKRCHDRYSSEHDPSCASAKRSKKVRILSARVRDVFSRTPSGPSWATRELQLRSEAPNFESDGVGGGMHIIRMARLLPNRGCPGRCWNSAAARVTFYATCSTSVASPRPRR